MGRAVTHQNLPLYRDPEIVHEVRTLLKLGMSLAAIAGQVHVSDSVVKRIRDRADFGGFDEGDLFPDMGKPPRHLA